MGLKEILEHHVLDHIWSWVTLGPLRLPISKHLLMMGIASFILLVVFPFIIRSRSAVLAPFRAMLEIMVLFLRDEVVIPSMGHKGAAYMGYFATLFFFVLILNLLGLVPYGSTATGNLAVTGGLAITSFLLINFAGIREQGLVGYFSHMVPKGVPALLYPILFPIELLGLFTKAFALCVRLFANMIAGHMVILSFVSFILLRLFRPGDGAGRGPGFRRAGAVHAAAGAVHGFPAGLHFRVPYGDLHRHGDAPALSGF